MTCFFTATIKENREATKEVDKIFLPRELHAAQVLLPTDMAGAIFPLPETKAFSPSWSKTSNTIFHNPPLLVDTSASSIYIMYFSSYSLLTFESAVRTETLIERT